MPNAQVTIGGTAASIGTTDGTSSPSTPSSGGWKLYSFAGTATVIASGTLPASGGSSTSGHFTVSDTGSTFCYNGGGSTSPVLTLAASSGASTATGLYFAWFPAGQTSPAYRTVDLVAGSANTQVVVGGSGVTLTKDATNRAVTSMPSGPTLLLIDTTGATVASATVSTPSATSQTVTLGNYLVTGVFAAYSASAPATILVSEGSSGAAATNLAIAYNNYTSGNVTGTYTFDSVPATAPTTAPTITATSGAGLNTVTLGAALPAGYVADVFAGAAAGAEGATAIGTISGGVTYADTAAPVGTARFYTAKYRNSAGSGPASAEVSATAGAAPAPDFSLSAVLIGAGAFRVAPALGQWQITVTPLNGFTGDVLFTMAPLAGAEGRFGPGNPPPPGYHGSVVDLRLSILGNTAGTYSPVVTATAGSLSHTLTLPGITVAAAPDYSTGVAVL